MNRSIPRWIGIDPRLSAPEHTRGWCSKRQTRRESCRAPPYAPAPSRSIRPLSLQAESPHGLCVRNARAAAPDEPVARFRDVLYFIGRLRFVVDRRAELRHGSKYSMNAPDRRRLSKDGRMEAESRGGGDAGAAVAGGNSQGGVARQQGIGAVRANPQVSRCCRASFPSSTAS
jgi:hypothetical protein